jgi:tubulin polyglutamylase TTLL6/13
MKPANYDIPFNGSFEDSDLEDLSQSEEEEESDDEVRKRKKQIPKPKKVVYSGNKIIMNVSGKSPFIILDTQYPVVKFVGKMIMKWKL